MNGEGAGESYSLTEIFAVKFVLADVVIILALLFAGPLYAVAITALLLLSVFATWHLVRRVGTGSTDGAGRDPVTTLQERYAAGELTEAEFEAKLDRLVAANERAEREGLETEDLQLERSS